MKNYKYIIFSLLIVLMSCENQFFEAEPENNPEALFEELWSTFNTDYAPFEERNVNWEEQYSLFRPEVNMNTTDEELYQVFKNMLSSLNDGHVQMAVPDRKYFFSNSYYQHKTDDNLFNLELIEDSYITSGLKKMSEDHLTMGWIQDIGYVHLKWVYTFMFTNDILDYFADAKALIIDLRHNGGGDFTWTYSQFGRFTEEERYTHRSKTKTGTGKDDYSDWYEWYVYPNGEYYNKPLILLTDRYTMSAAERATMAFKTLPNLVHVGDTTNGSQSTMIPRELANGWIYTVAPQKIEFMDGKSYEGIGLIPDILVENSAVEMEAGIDKTLEKALQLIK